MLDVTLEFDRTAFDNATDSFVNRDVQAALIDAVNFTATRVQGALRAEMMRVFDRPTPFTLMGVNVWRARPTDGGDPTAIVFLMDRQAAYLALEIEGGTRRAGDVATTRLGPLVPGPAAQKDSFGNLPRGYVQAALQDPNVAWVTLRPGEPPVLIRHVPGQRVEILASIIEEAHYEARLDFYGTALRAVEQAWPQASFPVFD